MNIKKIIQDLLILTPHTKIAHHIPGRIRFKISFSGLKALKKTSIDQALGSIQGVSNIRINPIARSTTIEYDQNILPVAFWENLGQMGKQPELSSKIQKHLESLRG